MLALAIVVSHGCMLATNHLFIFVLCICRRLVIQITRAIE